jgi:AcrR family transcriptional regulator
MTLTRNGKKGGDEALVLALSSGVSVAKAAEQAGVSQRTVYRRLEDPAFRQKVEESRTRLVDAVIGRLAALGGVSVDQLGKLVASGESESVRLNAVRTVLQHLFKREQQPQRAPPPPVHVAVYENVTPAEQLRAMDELMAKIRQIRDRFARENMLALPAPTALAPVPMTVADTSPAAADRDGQLLAARVHAERAIPSNDPASTAKPTEPASPVQPSFDRQFRRAFHPD